VDLSNKSAFITTPTGRTLAAWSGVTRRTALELAQAAGWTPAGEWALTYPPDGFFCPVRPIQEDHQ
jgi:hypothetical protein